MTALVSAIVAVLGSVLGVAAALLCVPVMVLLVQMLAAWPKRGSEPPFDAGMRPRLAVLMPAHDEAGGIARALHSVMAQLRAGDCLLVVADNCSDDTAAIVRAAGAEVVERSDAARRGKGYALDFGMRHLEAAPDAPAVVVVIDADCTLAAGCLDRLAVACLQHGRPVQARYLMHAPPGADLKTRIAEFAQVLKNRLRALGYQRLGLPCQLMGTGMAFPWPVLQAADLASGAIVEDLKLGIDLTIAGTPPLFCDDASVQSELPSSAAGALSQRTRWEHGHLGAMVEQGPRLAASALRSGRLDLAAMALDLSVPPLALLVTILASLGLATGGFALVGGSAAPWWLVVAAGSMLVVAIGLAWWRGGREIVSGGDMLRIPLYILAKLPIYLKLVKRRETEWVRTERDDGRRP